LQNWKLEIRYFRPKQIVATADHNVPTLDQNQPIRDELSRNQVQQLTENCKKNNIELYGLGHQYQGIVHYCSRIGRYTARDEHCGDSHTSTHGAFGALLSELGQVR
jgi:3-isopropylmalate/(R)-2-methylmalate dehydratase large subunit